MGSKFSSVLFFKKINRYLTLCGTFRAYTKLKYNFTKLSITDNYHWVSKQIIYLVSYFLNIREQKIDGL